MEVQWIESTQNTFWTNLLLSKLFFFWSICWKYHNDYSLNYIPKDLQQHYKCQQECLGMYKTPKISQYFASFISCKQQSQHGLSVKIKRITKKAVAHFNSMKINYTVMWTNIQSLCTTAQQITEKSWAIMSLLEVQRLTECCQHKSFYIGIFYEWHITSPGITQAQSTSHCW